jgi:hypothetical protein
MTPEQIHAAEEAIIAQVSSQLNATMVIVQRERNKLIKSFLYSDAVATSTRLQNVLSYLQEGHVRIALSTLADRN